MATLRKLPAPIRDAVERARRALEDEDGVELNSDEDVDALFVEVRRRRAALRETRARRV